MVPGLSTPMGDYQRGTGTIVHVDGLCVFEHERALRILKMLTHRDPATLYISTTLDLAGCPAHKENHNGHAQ